MQTLGKNGPAISPVGLGGWEAGGGRTWGPNASDAQVVDTLRTGFDAGANWIDTAEVYAQGRSEEMVGRALSTHPDVMAFTKVGPRPDGSGVRAPDIARAVEGSLRRLGREVIDLYQMHWRDPAVPLEETWSAMADLQDRGLVLHIGLSNVTADDVLLCETIRHVDALQIQGSLLYRDELYAALATCRANGTGVLCYGPLAFGLLTDNDQEPYTDWRSGTYGLDDFFVAENVERFFAADTLGQMRSHVARVRALADDLGCSTVDLAIGWLVSHVGIAGAIAGTRNPGHVAQNIRAGARRLDAAHLARLKDLDLP